MPKSTIVVLEGDQTGQELLEESLRVLDPKETGVETDFQRFDLSLENRRRSNNAVVFEAAAAIQETGLGLKAASITPEEKDDVGSPNAILREAIDAKVILRTGRRIPGVRPMAGVYAPIAVVRMAVEDAYGGRVSGANPLARKRSPIERKSFRARPAGRWPSFLSNMRTGPVARCSAAPSTPFPRYTKGCSRKSWIPPMSVIHKCAMNRT